MATRPEKKRRSWALLLLLLPFIVLLIPLSTTIPTRSLSVSRSSTGSSTRGCPHGDFDGSALLCRSVAPFLSEGNRSCRRACSHF